MTQSYVPDLNHQRPTAIQTYQGYGNQRPLGDVLRRVSGALAKRAQPTNGCRLILADVCIDAAMTEPNKADYWLNEADATLNEVIGDIERLELRGHETAFAGQARNLTTAYLRQAELFSWRRAAKGQEVDYDYDHLLSAAVGSVGLIPYSANVPPLLREFMPVLLGARGRARKVGGWLARLTLDREDHRSIMGATGNNTNWDVGISAGRAPKNYDQPELRIDMKTSSKGERNGRQEHARTAIGTLCAASCGLTNTKRIIWSCVQEADGIVHEQARDMQLLSTAELDALAERVAQAGNFPAETPESKRTESIRTRRRRL